MKPVEFEITDIHKDNKKYTVKLSWKPTMVSRIISYIGVSIICAGLLPLVIRGFCGALIFLSSIIS